MWLTFCACFSYLICTGRALTQVVSRQSFTVESRVQSQVSPCGICGEKSGTGASFSSSISHLPARFHRCSIRITPTLHKLINWQRPYIKRTFHSHVTWPVYLILLYLFTLLVFRSRCQWPRSLRSWSAADRLMRLWVRISPGAWMSVCFECCVLSGRSLCDSSRGVLPTVVCRCVWSRNLVNGEALAHWGLLRQKQTKL